MTTPNRSTPTRPSRTTVAAVLTTMALLAAWFMIYGHNNPAARECLALYREAHTAADSARVDSTLSGQGRSVGTEPRSCGALREFGKWK